MARHRATEFRKFLDEVERNVPADLDVHAVMDNYGTHITKLIRHWFAKRPTPSGFVVGANSPCVRAGGQVSHGSALGLRKMIRRDAYENGQDSQIDLKQSGRNAH